MPPYAIVGHDATLESLHTMQTHTSAATAGIGIDDMSMYIPRIYFDIRDLAAARGIEYDKLSKGLGLLKMAMPDYHEDAATMAANAVADLIAKNQLDPRHIGRIYMGTESALDGAKPTATYVLDMLRQRFEGVYGSDCLRHCDVIDMTFACVGGVDALHNTVDWVSADPSRIGIVVTTDYAKYDLASTGEYTQGAGAIAMLVKAAPRLLAFSKPWGVATEGVHDFFKPKLEVSKEALVREVLELAGVAEVEAMTQAVMQKISASLDQRGLLDGNDTCLSVRSDAPVFDGPYSNQCYQDRIGEAYEHFVAQLGAEAAFDLFQDWAYLVFHLPYAFHAKRIFSDIYVKALKANGGWAAVAAELEVAEPQAADYDSAKAYDKAHAQFLKAVSKTPAYRAVVKSKIEKGQRASSEVGNMYACSIFLSLMSVLESALTEGQDLAGHKLGFFGYGSGSKSKVFEATLQPTWATVVSRFRVFETLGKRQAIDYATYEALHKGAATASVIAPSGTFALAEVGTEGVHKGARHYTWHA